MDEERLIRLAAAGESAAGELLYARYWRGVYRTAFRYVGNSQDAEDIMQDTFVKAFKALGRFDYRKEGGFPAWLNRISAHSAIELLRKNRRQYFDMETRIELLPDLTGVVGASPAEITERRALLAEVRRGMASLSPAQRAVFDKRHLLHREIRDIAAEMNCAPTSVKKHLERGIAKLRKHLRLLWRPS
jgi:RNA polymerase sigma-70 factor (ECF subfamily)